MHALPRFTCCVYSHLRSRNGDPNIALVCDFDVSTLIREVLIDPHLQAGFAARDVGEVRRGDMAVADGICPLPAAFSWKCVARHSISFHQDSKLPDYTDKCVEFDHQLRHFPAIVLIALLLFDRISL